MRTVLRFTEKLSSYTKIHIHPPPPLNLLLNLNVKFLFLYHGTFDCPGLEKNKGEECQIGRNRNRQICQDLGVCTFTDFLLKCDDIEQDAEFDAMGINNELENVKGREPFHSKSLNSAFAKFYPADLESTDSQSPRVRFIFAVVCNSFYK